MPEPTDEFVAGSNRSAAAVQPDASGQQPTTPAVASGAPVAVVGPARLPRLISRLYAAADIPSRARILAGLMRPLGTLGLAAVAAGAFADFASRQRGGHVQVGIEEAGRYSTEQVFELAQFVQQVNPEALQRVAHFAASSPTHFTAFGVGVALVVLRWFQRRSAAGGRE
jgi:hypothetical protein